MNTVDSSVPHPYPHRWWIFAVLSVSLLVIALDNTILNVALPTLARDLSASESQLQWMVDAYTLVFAGLLLTMGSLGDRFGRRKALIVGLSIFGLGSIWAAFSGSASLLIAARVVMGIGGALIMPATLSITTNIFTGNERGRAIGAWAGVLGLAIIIGPVFGGWLLEHFPWGAIFLVNLPIILLIFLGIKFIVPESRDPAAPRLDPVGALLSIAGLTALLWGIIEVPSNGWGDSRIITSFIIAAVLLPTFVIWELRTSSPMLDMKLFRNPRFSAASIVLTVTLFSLFGTTFFLVQYLQFVLGYTPLQAGTGLLPLIPTLLLGSILGPRLVERIGTKIPVVMGLVITAGGLALLSTVSTSSGYGLVVWVLVIVGLGLGLTMPPSTNSIMGALPLGKAGVGSAVNDTTRQLGGALGVAVLGSVLSAVYQSNIDGSAFMRILPPSIWTLVHDSIGKASMVAARIGGQAGQELSSAINSAFITGMSRAVLVTVATTLVGALLALLFLPAYEKKQDTQDNVTQPEVASPVEKELESIPQISQL